MTDDGVGDDDRGGTPHDAVSSDYGGLLGAIRYAYRATGSRLMRTYVVVGTLLAALVALLFVQALVVLLSSTADVGGGTLTLSRAFFVVVALAVVGPLLAPVVSTARRHRHGTGDAGTDRRMAALGYAFVGAVYLALVVSAPEALRETVDGPFGPVVEALYALPWYVGAVPPVVVAIAMWVVHRRALRRNAQASRTRPSER